MCRGLAITIGALCIAGPGAAREKPPPLEVVGYGGLLDAVHAAEGDVVLVDFWYDACLQCKREFPHLVALQDRHRKAGLTAIAVNLDDANDAELRERVTEFLAAQRSTCRHLMLNEAAEVWQAKLKIEMLPCVFLFDREGRLLSRWDGDEVDYEAIGRRVSRALNETERK